MRVALPRRQCTGVLALLCAVAAVVLASAAGASANSGGVLSAGAGCSKATAKALIDQHSLNGFVLPPAQVLCGPFTGPGSNAMAVTIAAGTCWSPQGLAVFSFSGGSWRLVLSQRAFIVPPLVAVGSDIRETTRVFRPGESGCNPTVTQTRLWHWNGTTLTAKKQATALHLGDFLSPDRKVWCGIGSAQSFCATGRPGPANPPQRGATLYSDGRVTLCDVPVPSLGAGCIQNWDPSAPILRVGQETEMDGVLCKSETNGITCTLTSGPGAGKGFLINSSNVRRVGP